MASPVLHVKDSYYFEVPKALWRHRYTGKEDFPAFWVRLDGDYQQWAAQRVLGHLQQLHPELDAAHLRQEHADWQRLDHSRASTPLEQYLLEQRAEILASYQRARQSDSKAEQGPPTTLATYLQEHPHPCGWFALRMEDPNWAQQFELAVEQANQVTEYRQDPQSPAWSPEKVAGYNRALAGKILIPQPFGQLKNLYEPASGFCISKYMVIELLVALLMVAMFGWLARRLRQGDRPRGRLWNLLELFLLFIRDKIARPAIGSHDGDRFVPLLWTIFFFVLLCNLFGLVPWLGSPTSAFGATTGLALVTLGTGIGCGVLKFGPLGYLKNQVPHMDLPWILAIIIKPMLFAIELLGLCIKHAVLAIRLLANMVAGHLVILGIMGLAFGAHAALQFAGAPTWKWGTTAAIAVAASTLFNVLELLVAFLQAYIFTFLSALFIGTAIHHH